ncbi:MAG: hypothetical protein ABIJ00_11475 [Candidatus Eisenbacteria bacterium]
MKARRRLKPDHQSGSGFISRYHLVIALLVVLTAFSAVHGRRVIANYSTYQWEDGIFIKHNAATIHSLGDCFTSPPVWPGLYRPLTTNLYYYLGRKLFSNNVGIHHLINVGVCLVNGLLLYLVCMVFLPRVWALVAAGIFVSRFSHVEVVLNTCEIQTLLAVFFSLVALNLFIRGRRLKRNWLVWAALIAFVLALFSKETSLVLPAIFIIYWWLFGERGGWRHYLAPLVAGGVWVILFAFFFRRVTSHQPTGFSYNFSLSHLLEGGATYLLTFFNSLSFRLESIVMVPGIAGAAATGLVKAGFGLIVAVVVVFFLRYPGSRNRYSQSGRIVIFGSLFFLTAVAPYVVLESRLFMRYGYLGHAGLAISAAAVLREALAALAATRGLQPQEPGNGP